MPSEPADAPDREAKVGHAARVGPRGGRGDYMAMKDFEAMTAAHERLARWFHETREKHLVDALAPHLGLETILRLKRHPGLAQQRKALLVALRSHKLLVTEYYRLPPVAFDDEFSVSAAAVLYSVAHEANP